MEDKKYYKTLRKDTFIQILINICLFIIKLIGGLLSHSLSLTTDSFDSLSDSITSSFSYFSSIKASKKEDKDHQFGHEKIENLVAFLISIVIIISGIYLGYTTISSLINKTYLDIDLSNFILAIILLSASILIKILMGLYIFFDSKRINSSLLKANSLDYMLDSFKSILTLISLILIYYLSSKYNFIYLLDPIVSLLISLIIIIGASKIFIENASSLIDKAVSKKELNEIKAIIMSTFGVIHIDVLRSRKASNKIFLEIEISVSDDLSLKEAHDISESIKNELMRYNNDIKFVLVHVNPYHHDDDNEESKKLFN